MPWLGWRLHLCHRCWRAQPPSAREPASIRDIFRPRGAVSLYAPEQPPRDPGGPRFWHPGHSTPQPAARLERSRGLLQLVTADGRAVELPGAQLQDGAGVPLALGEACLLGRVVDFELYSVESAPAGGVGDAAATRAALQAALEGGAGAVPATVWRLCGVRDDKRGTVSTAAEVAAVMADKLEQLRPPPAA